jgi:hypothetical protein
MNRKTNTFTRLGGIAGIGFAALILLLNLLVLVPAGFPEPGAGPEQAHDFFTDGRSAMDLASAFLPAVWVLATLFGAAAVAAVRTGERERGEAWALVGLAGVLMQNLNVASVSALRLALAHTEDEGVTALWAFHEALFGLNGTFLALALVGLSMSGVRGGLIPVWLAVMGFAAAVLQFASAVLTPQVMDGASGLLGLAGWLTWVAWLVLSGLALTRIKT